jgi:hypothetical protein
MYDRSRNIAIAARAALARGWIQGHQAHDANGNFCDPSDDRAVSFCIIGAIEHGRSELVEGYWPCTQILERLRKKVCTSPVAWNDKPGRTKEEVLAIFDAVIADFEASDADLVALPVPA